MKTLKSIIITLLIVFVMSAVVVAQKNDIYVNPDTGNDQNAGSKEQPVKTNKIKNADTFMDHSNSLLF